MTDPVSTAVHYESAITFERDAAGALQVRKRYRQEVPCVRWLNQRLAGNYDPNKALPVAQHEFAALQALEKFDIAPKPLGLEPDAIVMTYAGKPLGAGTQIDPLAYREQCQHILRIFHQLGLHHNDMLPANVLIDNGRVRVIDFTLAEFGGIKLMSALPNPSWARPGQDENILAFLNEVQTAAAGRRSSVVRRAYRGLWRRARDSWDDLTGRFFPRRKLRLLARSAYNYHNLGAGVFPCNQEKTPFGSGERYNFDRMYMLVSNYDFTRKSVLDVGCNSGWFCVQAKLLGSGVTVGVDWTAVSDMGQALKYAIQFERVFKLGIDFVNANLAQVDFNRLAARHGLPRFDAALVFSVLHHFDIEARGRMFAKLFDAVGDVIFYEDHEFWNDLEDTAGKKITVLGEGYRFGWNEDLSWQRKMGSTEKHEPKVLEAYRNSWRNEALMLDRYAEVKLMGFSEKRRPMLALFKRKP
jgi:SAM-dependent methyltransferase